MTVSISLTDRQLAFLDEKVERGVYPSRSAAVAAGIRSLLEKDLVRQYEEMFAEYDEQDEAWIGFADAIDDEDAEP